MVRVCIQMTTRNVDELTSRFGRLGLGPSRNVQEAAARVIQKAWRRSPAGPNMITLDRYPRKYSIRKPGQSFDARALAKMLLHGDDRWPHSRQPITNAEKKRIVDVSAGDATQAFLRELTDTYYFAMRVARGRPDPRFRLVREAAGIRTWTANLKSDRLGETVVAVVSRPASYRIDLVCRYGWLTFEMRDGLTSGKVSTSGTSEPDIRFGKAANQLLRNLAKTRPWQYDDL